MIKKLRFKFILASMASILLVLAATIGGINIANYVTVQKEVDSACLRLIERGFEEELPPGEPGQEGEPRPMDLQREHYFLVSFSPDGSILDSDFRHIFIVNEEEGKELASSVYEGKKEKGREDNLYYRKAVIDGVTYVSFVDAKERLDSFHSFLTWSLIISAASYALIFVLIFFSSKRIFRVSEESHKKQKSFITNASHELKTPLTVISTDLELIEMDHGESEWTLSIKDQVERLTKMTNLLVTLSRLEEDPSKYPFEEFSLSSCLKESAERFAPSFQQKGLEFETEVEDGVFLHGNRFLIEELISIFLDNALKYASKDVGVSLKKDKKGKAILSFENDISPEDELDPNLLFERFYRSPNAKSEGSGIGLSIAKEIADLHKGSVKAIKENGHLNFSVLL